MARVGLKSALFNQMDKDTKKYKDLENDEVPKLGRIIDEKFSPENNSAELYADDALAESDYSFKKGTLSITVADDDDTVDSLLLGNSAAEDGEVTKNIEDVAPEIGYGHIVTKLIKGVKKYKVEFFPRVKVTKITTDGKTRGENTEFGTTAIEGTVLALDEDFNGLKAGDWEKHKTLDTYPAAFEYLKTLLTPSVN